MEVGGGVCAWQFDCALHWIFLIVRVGIDGVATIVGPGSRTNVVPCLDPWLSMGLVMNLPAT